MKGFWVICWELEVQSYVFIYFSIDGVQCKNEIVCISLLKDNEYNKYHICKVVIAFWCYYFIIKFKS